MKNSDMPAMPLPLTHYSDSQIVTFSNRVKENYVFSFSSKKHRDNECEILGIESTFSAVDCSFYNINDGDDAFLRVCELDDSPGFIISMKGICIHPKSMAVQSDSMPFFVKKLLLILGWLK